MNLNCNKNKKKKRISIESQKSTELLNSQNCLYNCPYNFAIEFV